MQKNIGGSVAGGSAVDVQLRPATFIVGNKTVGTISYMGGVAAVLENFCWAWSQMCVYNSELWVHPPEIIHYDRCVFSDHAPARNSLVHSFMGDWLIMLDTDHAFEPDLCRRLVYTADKYGVDVLSGLYLLKRPPFLPVAWAGDPIRPIASWPKELKVIQIASAGAGCLFVRRNVFQTLGEDPFSRLPGLSEDHSFFHRCREAGIKTYLAPHIEANHLSVNKVTLSQMEQPRGTIETSVEGF